MDNDEGRTDDQGIFGRRKGPNDHPASQAVTTLGLYDEGQTIQFPREVSERENDRA